MENMLEVYFLLFLYVTEEDFMTCFPIEGAKAIKQVSIFKTDLTGAAL